MLKPHFIFPEEFLLGQLLLYRFSWAGWDTGLSLNKPSYTDTVFLAHLHSEMTTKWFQPLFSRCKNSFSRHVHVSYQIRKSTEESEILLILENGSYAVWLSLELFIFSAFITTPPWVQVTGLKASFFLKAPLGSFVHF